MDANAIEVKASQVPGKVSFNNFEELKQYLRKGLSFYKTTAYSVENIEQAENDLKELKAVKKKLSDKKKELETAYSMPIEEVKAQLDELINMVKEPMDIIDKMIKDNSKAVKEKEILTYARMQSQCLGERAEKILSSPSFFNPKWLNITYKTKDWQNDVNRIIGDAADAFQTINKVGGKSRATLLAYYYDRLSLDGADSFLKTASSEMTDDVSESDMLEDNTAFGYKILKIYGTERQMLKLISELELSEFDFEEIEDGMPKPMMEVFTPDFSSFVAFDIEHTGTFGIEKGDAESEIVEIGAVKVVDGQIVDRFDMLANPGRRIVPMITRITGITDDMVAGEPSTIEVIKAFKNFTGDDILVGHNIGSCDIPHIVRAAGKAKISFDNKYLDTKKLAAKYKEKNGWKDIKLTTLSNYYGIDQNEAHRAWCDAEANAYVYLKLKQEQRI